MTRKTRKPLTDAPARAVEIVREYGALRPPRARHHLRTIEFNRVVTGVRWIDGELGRI